jgi:hypothetical protein
MRTKTKILTTVAAGALALGAFAAGAAADDGNARQARNEMHIQMGGDMGAGMMTGDAWESMQEMHDAIDPAAMQEMHDQMVELLPADLRDDADAMHNQMFPAMSEGSGVQHASHHPTGS